MSWKIDDANLTSLSFKEADTTSAGERGYSPPDQTRLAEFRRAAVFGVGLGGDCTVGACKKYVPRASCTTAYDIETLMDKNRPGGFALVDSDILSISAKCSCGWEFYTSANSSNTSSSMVSQLLLAILEHMPMWTIGWNSYNFDNECMKHHAVPAVKEIFMVSRTGAFNKPTYGSIINIPGSYNVDLLLYMHKSLYKLPSFKLGEVAEHMKVTRKMKMPQMDGKTDDAVLREYNMNDCVVTLDIWKKENMEYIIPSIAACTSSPIYDCSRYVTGTLASLGYSSYCLSKGFILNWTQCTSPQSYKGGYVMEPKKGLHRNVLVCDFSSMYPTIIATCNINPHDFDIRDAQEGEKDGDVSIGRHTTRVTLGGTTVFFDNTTESVMSGFMKYLIEERKSNKKLYPMYASSLKVFSNSVYGSLGYENSTLYSPLCAASITAIGRYCVKMARRCFLKEGMTIVYGDTDSCMVTYGETKEDTLRAASRALSNLHSYMAKTSLHMMKMEIEEFYPKALMTDKKRYCMLLEDGSMKRVGISLSRRDVSGICKEAARTTIDAIFMDDVEKTRDSISVFVSSISYMAAQNMLTLSDISKYVKRNGINCYSYTDADGKTKDIPEDKAVLSSVVEYDLRKCMETVSMEVERFTVPCGLGSVSDIMKSSRMAEL